MNWEEDQIEDANVTAGYRTAQILLDRFVAINYETARNAMWVHGRGDLAEPAYYQQQIVDIIRHNPPLESVPRYFRDGRANYLWYSDFYDDSTKDVMQRYRQFVAPDTKITPANYAAELARIDLPYFKELVNLICLEKLLLDAEANAKAVAAKVVPSAKEPTPAAPTVEPVADVQQPDIKPTANLQPAEESPKPGKPDPPAAKRSYDPRLNDKQYELLAKCVEKLNLFRRPVSVGQLKKLLKGKLPDPLQVSNQKSLTCLLDELAAKQYIKGTWITIADNNKDFISFRRGLNVQRYGSDPFPIPFQQFVNSRTRNQREYVDGLFEIEDLIKAMGKCPDK